MANDQCWAALKSGTRCEEPAEPGRHWCRDHGSGSGPHPCNIWRAPEVEMPPDLVAAIRRHWPAATFPTPAPTPEEPTPPLTHPVSRITDDEAGPPDPVHPGPVPCEFSPCPSDIAWLQRLLQQSMTELMASDAAPLPKAGALARLGNLYLKAVRAEELQRENRELRQRVAALEKANTALEQRIAALERPGSALSRRGDPELPLSEVLTRSFEARLLERAERAVAAGLASPPETRKERKDSPPRHGAGERRLGARDERQHQIGSPRRSRSCSEEGVRPPRGPGPGETPGLMEPEATGTETAPMTGSGGGARYG